MRGLLIGAVLLAGCATDSGIVQMAPDTYRLYRQAATGFVGSDAIKSDLTFRANEFCASKGQFVEVISSTTGSPPYILGNFPKAELQFRCAATPSTLPQTAL
jgi:hypothetical protein